MRKGITIDDLPAKYRDSVRRQLGLETAGCVREGKASMQGVDGAKPKAASIRMKNRNVPNKTEAEYDRRHLNCKGLYEPVTFRLAGGSRYTPDFMTVDAEGRITFHEVKGSYRLHSHGRARTAFRECAAAFQMFGWVWATRQQDGSYQLETY